MLGRRSGQKSRCLSLLEERSFGPTGSARFEDWEREGVRVVGAAQFVLGPLVWWLAAQAWL